MIKIYKGFVVNMSAGVVAALIAGAFSLFNGVLTLVGVIIANRKSAAVADYKIEELTREVREHNNFAKRMPVVEEQIKVINHRIDDLEHAH